MEHEYKTNYKEPEISTANYIPLKSKYYFTGLQLTTF